MGTFLRLLSKLPRNFFDTFGQAGALPRVLPPQQQPRDVPLHQHHQQPPQQRRWTGAVSVVVVAVLVYNQYVLCRKHVPDKLSVLTIENMTTLRIPTMMTLMTMKILLRNMMIMRWRQTGG